MHLAQLTPAEAAAEEAEGKANAFFDGVLPPFSNIGNTAFGSTPDAPTLRGIGELIAGSTDQENVKRANATVFLMCQPYS